MKRQRRAAALGLLLILSSQPSQTPGRQASRGADARRQTQPARPAATPEQEEEVVRVTANLVQIDAVVTDGRGARVGDLRAEDFEVVAGGRRQQITDFSYIPGAAAEAAPKPPPRKPSAADAGAPPVSVRRPGQARRMVALVVDNFCTSSESTRRAREALRKFIAEQMRPGDLVAVVQTLEGGGAPQQFTADKRLLLAAVERVRYNISPSRGFLCERDVLAPIVGPPVNLPPPPGNSPSDPDALHAPSDEGRENFRAGRFATLRFILRGLRELPGRKAMVLLTDNMPAPKAGDGGESKRRLDGLVDLAARASTVIYTVDLRGLQTYGLTAADAPRPMTARAAQDVHRTALGRSTGFYGSQAGMEYLAHETGGIFKKNTNDIPAAVQSVFEDQQGYYLIAFRPGPELFDPANGRIRFNGLSLKVRRPGLRVRTRSGFYGYADDEARRGLAAAAKADPLFAAAASPFGASEVGVGLTSLFREEPGKGPTLRALLHVNLGDLSFEDEADDWRKTTFEVFGAVFDADGNVVEKETRTETVRAKGRTLEHILREGLVYSMIIPARRPGVYQLRVAVRDVATEKLGAAGQLVEVPSLADGRLALSGIVLQGGEAAKAAAAAAEGEPQSDPLRGLALRRFRRGTQLDFFYDIYNAKADPATGRPRLQTQVRLFRDGKAVFTGDAVPFDPKAQTDARRLAASSRIVLGTDLAPGDYALQVVVTDALADQKRRVATQWVDFQIVQ